MFEENYRVFMFAANKFNRYTCLCISQVAITPESISRARNRWIINELVSLHKQHLDGRLPVYDGRKSLFTAGPLPFKSKEFVLKLRNPERASQGYVCLNPLPYIQASSVHSPICLCVLINPLLTTDLQ